LSTDTPDPTSPIRAQSSALRAPFASRGGLKLEHALDHFAVEVTGLRCADFGCNVGGFTDCLLRRGAAAVIAVDTGYGTLAWRLRNDSRVTVRERSNAIHAPAPQNSERVDLVVIDMGWTPQRLCIPAALRWLQPGVEGVRIVTLIKPHYELAPSEKSLLQKGVLAASDAGRIRDRTLAAMPALGAAVLGCTASPILGGGSKHNAGGNTEYLALLAPIVRAAITDPPSHPTP